MKALFFPKNRGLVHFCSVLFCSVSLLFACGVADDLSLDADLADGQEISRPIDGDAVVSLDKATEIADLFFRDLTGGDVSTRSAKVVSLQLNR